MKHYFSLHWESARSAAVSFIRQPLATLLILAMLAIAMTLPLALYLGVQSSRTVLDKLNDVPQITLYLELNADEGDSNNVRQLLNADARIKEQRFVGKDEGLAELKAAMGSQDVVSMLDDNPLPDVFVVTPADAAPEAVVALQNDLAQYPMVESTQLDKEWLQTLYQVNRFVQSVFWFLAVTLSLAFVLVAHNTIRLQILSHKEEIEITKLLGAPSSFVRRPFLYQAAWQSVLSAVISLGLCAWLMNALEPLITHIFKPYGVHLQWRFFGASEILLVLLVVCGLGIGGAWLASTQHLLGFKASKN